MRFPFFKSQKPETKEPINTASKSPAPANNKLGATQRIPVGVLSSPRLNKAAAPAPAPAPVAAKPATPVPVANGPSVTLKVTSISTQIPTQVFSAQGRATVANATVSIPVHVILPQLATGKVSIKLGELLTFFAPALLRSPLPPFPEQQVVVLPLEEVIPAIPHDLLSVTHESVISADDPELGKLPTLIDDESLAAHRRTRSNASSLADTQPVRRMEDPRFEPKVEAKVEPKVEPKPEPKVEAPKPVYSAPVAPRPTGGRLEHVVVSMRGLVAVLPDSIFQFSRGELIAKTQGLKPVMLPAETIIPQLRTGAAKLSVSVIVSLLPQELLANPLPALDGMMAALPLAEIIPQLPPNLFTEDLREPAQVAMETDLDIPDPFQDKSVLAQAAAAAAAAPVVETPVNDEDGVDVAALEDESFAIFSEKKAPAPAAPVIEVKDTVPISVVLPPPPAPVAVPVPEPVAEIKPQVPTRVIVAEPAADVAPVVEAPIEDAKETVPVSVILPPRPVAEPIVAPAPAPEPVVEAKAVEPVIEPTPVVAPEPVAEIKPVELAPVAEVAPVVVPEPVAAEPVAEIKPVEPAPVNDGWPVARALVTPEPTVAPAPVVPAPAPVEVTPEPVAAAPVEPAPVEVAPATTSEAAYADGDLSDDEEHEALAVVAKTETPADGLRVADERKFLVDLNRCTAEDLMAIPGIGRGLAQRIIDFRNAQGSFTSIEQLRQVPGIGRKTYRALAGVQPRALNRLLGAPHDGELTLQEIVRYTGKLPGIAGCMLALSDGLFLTGQLPEHLDKDTISVFAPQLFKKVGRYSRELKVGSIRRFTIFTDTQPLSIFKAGDVYLIIVHDAQRYSKALLRRCERISEEIARLSSQRVTV